MILSLVTMTELKKCCITNAYLQWPMGLLFLAHLSYCDHSPSVHPLTSLNDVSSETAEPNFFKLHVEPHVKGGLKIYTNGHGP